MAKDNDLGALKRAIENLIRPTDCKWGELYLNSSRRLIDNCWLNKEKQDRTWLSWLGERHDFMRRLLGQSAIPSLDLALFKYAAID